MFRTQNNVPDNYISESRDFQLLSRLYDLTYNSLRYNIDSMVNLNDSMKINDQFLPLLGTKVGFITNKNIDTRLWRYILSSFQYSLKYKGSIQGVRYAISSILRYEGKQESAIVDINYDFDSNILIIYLKTPIDNVEALNEYLKYILPAGCVYQINIGSIASDAYITTLPITDKTENETTKSEDYSSISNLENMTMVKKDESKPLEFPNIYETNNQVVEVIGKEDLQVNPTTNKIKKVYKNVKK